MTRRILVDTHKFAQSQLISTWRFQKHTSDIVRGIIRKRFLSELNNHDDWNFVVLHKFGDYWLSILIVGIFPRPYDHGHLLTSSCIFEIFLLRRVWTLITELNFYPSIYSVPSLVTHVLSSTHITIHPRITYYWTVSLHISCWEIHKFEKLLIQKCQKSRGFKAFVWAIFEFVNFNEIWVVQY